MEKGTAKEQFEYVRQTCKQLTRLVREGHRIAVARGNGPQVGDILLKNELAKGTLPVMPPDERGAATDKDLSAALLASSLGMDALLVLTDAEKVVLNFGRPDARKLDRLSVDECGPYLAQGQLPPSGMGPKTEAHYAICERRRKKRRHDLAGPRGRGAQWHGLDGCGRQRSTRISRWLERQVLKKGHKTEKGSSTDAYR